MREVCIVLARPARPVNVGAAARAMKTMGLSDLRIVGAAGIAGDEHARAVAHGSTELLEAVTYTATLDQALVDREIVVGTTARARGHLSHSVQAPDLAQFLHERSGRIAIVFGSEESGLSNAELAACQIVSLIPMRAAYPSLNLAQAVMVYCYELRSLLFQSQDAERTFGDAPSRRALAERLPQALERLGFDRGRSVHARIVERALRADDADTRLLHSAVNAVLKANIKPQDR